MLNPVSSLPTHESLKVGLNAIFGERLDGRDVTILERKTNEYASSSRSEIVTCQFPDGRTQRLFCKYENRTKQCWSDVAYEAEVYRRVVRPSGLPAATFYESYIDPENDNTWLIVEYLNDSVLLSELLESEPMCLAARWLGAFHASQDRRIASDELGFLKVYDANYYLKRVRQSIGFANGSGKTKWLIRLCDVLDELVPAVFAKRRTVSHGDFSPHNLLIREQTAYPIDWELSGKDLGEMDLASLLEGWNGNTAKRCKVEYKNARWPHGAPPDFDETFAVAKLCLCFHNLAHRPNWTSDSTGLWYSEQARLVGEQMGFI
jgi:Phosphotransferase enzyme family